jgi:hypothetical protein
VQHGDVADSRRPGDIFEKADVIVIRKIGTPARERFPVVIVSEPERKRNLLKCAVSLVVEKVLRKESFAMKMSGHPSRS